MTNMRSPNAVGSIQQLESILANRKRELGIAFESGRRLGLDLPFSHGIDLGRGRGIEI
jgi:hypothetical protein